MRLCVGAASRRIVEEAARLKVHQVVASRRQVAYPTGYIGLAPDTLVKLVRELSDGATEVVRDHGGPLQGGFNDDGVDALDADVDAGFHGLHVDVCELSRDVQEARLVELCDRYADTLVDIEIGGEHEHASWNTQLLRAVHDVGVVPRYVVVGAGTYVSHDQQLGYVHDGRAVRAALAYARRLNVETKVHNMDWIGSRRRYATTFDAYNLAPELGQIEVRAILTTLPHDAAHALLDYAYASTRWTRWFTSNIGTRVQRAECAIRYLLTDPHALEIIERAWSDDAESFVRGCVRDAIVHG